jgi:DNA-directed RNA polymerase specialized sigma24 family protein
MAVYRPVPRTQQHDYQPVNDRVWSELYGTLKPYILSWVYSSGVSSWHGQEHDIADDILQEAIIRTLKYMRLAESGKGLPIHSMTCFGRTVAHNHFRDLRRREMRLIRPNTQEGQDEVLLLSHGDDIDPSEVALDSLMRISVLMTVARVIVGFPVKQRTALLVDLANHTDLSDEDNQMCRAFAAVNVDLRDYCRVLPGDPQERSRHAASLSMAYKRLRQTVSMQASDLDL